MAVVVPTAESAPICSEEYELPLAPTLRNLTESYLDRNSTLISYPSPVRPPLIPISPKALLHRILHSRRFSALMVALTCYSLFGDDVRVVAFSLPSDNYFFALTTVCLLCFSLEVAAKCYVKRGYVWSFYCFLDVVATVSLIPDVGWIWGRILGTGESLGSEQVNGVSNTGKTARTAARASRIVRIVRLLRLVRLAKFYQSAHSSILKRRNSLSFYRSSLRSSLPSDFPEESRIGKAFTNASSKRVIALVLALLFVFPLCDLEFYRSEYTSWDYGTEELAYFRGGKGYEIAKKTLVEYHQAIGTPIVYLQMGAGGCVMTWERGFHSLRSEEQAISISGDQITIFDLRGHTQFEALLRIMLTLFICLILTIGTVYFTEDAHNMIIIPIEKMMNKAEILMKDPQAMLDGHISAISNIVRPHVPWWHRACCLPKSIHKSELETAAIEDALLKIGALLVVGFGDAGSRIIVETLTRKIGVEELTPGEKIMAIFGFCDIRNFTDMTEVLQENVIKFVNEVAGLVHHTVDQYMGAANKNIGDAFLVVWKLPPDTLSHFNGEISLKPGSHIVQNFADISLIAFLKVVIRTYRSPALLSYRSLPEIISRLPGYSVRLGFGLHVGWAIEGAMGSMLKIDVSYLSPDVNLAVRLEEITKTYDTQIAISGDLFNLFSPQTKKLCRHIDTLCLGLHIGVRIYTFDVDMQGVRSEGIARAFSKAKSNEKRINMRKIVTESGFAAAALMRFSKSLDRLVHRVDIAFNQHCSTAIAYYEHGQWEAAGKMMEECLRMKPGDKACIEVLRFMEMYGRTPPGDWEGYRKTGSDRKG